nr:MAG TPA: N-acetylmuramoyl-L-alanine amidase [Caudoviricetes sp.]
MPKYSNSSLVTYKKLSPMCSSRILDSNPTGKIDTITIHHMAGNLSIEACGEVFQNREASSNYGIGSDGRVGLYVDESMRSWASCSPANDSRAVTIEVANSVAGGEWPVSKTAYNVLIKLCADICKRNNIKRLNYTGNKSGNLTMHKWFAETACPGPYLSARFADIATQVNRLLANPTYQVKSAPSSFSDGGNSPDAVDTATAYDAAVSGGILPPETDITPYIVTINQHATAINFDKLKELGVIGVVVEIGSLFDVGHNRKAFRNPNLIKQVNWVNDAELMCGLYFNARAQDISEAKDEMQELYLAIKSLHPNLGLWVIPTFSLNKTKNNEIYKYYQKCFIQMGLKGQIGIYTKRSEIKKFDWKTFSEDWYLWIDDHINKFDNVTELLVPSFFALDKN